MTVGVVILARNEGWGLAKVIEALQMQTVDVTEMILVNDGSTDDTKRIAEDMGMKVIDFPIQHESWIRSKKLALVVNYGLNYLSRNLDYYMILGGDNILPPRYLFDVIDTMNRQNFSICSGIIAGEGGTVRGSGRVMTRELLESQDFGYKVNYGYETYMLFRAECDGFKTGIADIQSHVTRKTSTNYGKEQLHYKGIAYKCLGYSLWFCFGVAVKHYWMHPASLLSFFRGYNSCKPDMYYEDDIRRYVKKYQRSRLG